MTAERREKSKRGNYKRKLAERKREYFDAVVFDGGGKVRLCPEPNRKGEGNSMKGRMKIFVPS